MALMKKFGSNADHDSNGNYANAKLPDGLIKVVRLR